MTATRDSQASSSGTSATQWALLPPPLYYLGKMATLEEIAVVVTSDDLVTALHELVPSADVGSDVDDHRITTIRRQMGSVRMIAQVLPSGRNVVAIEAGAGGSIIERGISHTHECMI